MSDISKIKPLPLRRAFFYFAIPSVVLILNIYFVVPFLITSGVPPILGFIVFASPLVFMFIAALVAYRLEGWNWNWQEFKTRYRLQKLNLVDWLWVVGTTIVYVGSYLGLRFTTDWLEPHVPQLPEEFAKILGGLPETFAGFQLSGNWGIALLYLVILFFNIFGEELWWRGHILPRQELAHGSKTWIFHGIMWTLFHIFWTADLIRILPGALAISFAVQRRQNTWIGIIAHTVLNGLGFVAVLRGVLGNNK